MPEFEKEDKKEEINFFVKKPQETKSSGRNYNDLRMISGKDKVFFGVCAGVAYALQVKTWVVRGLALLLCFTPFPMLFLYFAAIAILKEWKETPEDYQKVCE